MKRPGESSRDTLGEYMLHLVRTTESDGGLKKVLAGIRFLEKLQWVPKIITQANWALVKAAGKYHEQRGTQYRLHIAPHIYHGAPSPPSTPPTLRHNRP